MDLFEDNSLAGQPLAARMRPRNLDEFIGQQAIMGKGRLLRRAIRADQISSLIFYGPPGTGKTTLAQVIAQTTKSRFVSLNAVLAGVKDLREAIEEAKEQKKLYSRKTILFVDEVHRWNKSQQDALLPWTENGTIILIGATTENPFFEVNRALVSRSRIFQLQPLSFEELMQAAHLALEDKERGYGRYNVQAEKGALEHLVQAAKGDCRALYNAIELAVETTPEQFPPQNDEPIILTLAIAEESIQKRALLYDKDGDYHYDTISAFIKSVRGSDPDAVLYWLARMVASGEDIDYLWRRMQISACEDVGLADPQAIVIVHACAEAYHRMGMPEGQYPLAQAALYLATAPKSNSTTGYYDAVKAVELSNNLSVPNHLKDDSRDGAAFGHGKGYKYPHAYINHWTAQAYLPDALKGQIFYHPGSLGYEGQLGEQITRRREEQLAVILNEEQHDEILTFTPSAMEKEKERWIRRAEAQASAALRELRQQIFTECRLSRQETVLFCGDESGYLLAEAVRQAPEGGLYALFSSEEHYNAVQHAFAGLYSLDQPHLFASLLANFQGDEESPDTYDQIVLYLVQEKLGDQLAKARSLMNASSRLYLAVNGIGSTLSVLGADLLSEPQCRLLREAEEQSYNQLTESYYTETLTEAGLSGTLSSFSWQEYRSVTEKHLSLWLGESSVFGQSLMKAGADDTDFVAIKEALMPLTRQPVLWQKKILKGNFIQEISGGKE